MEIWDNIDTDGPTTVAQITGLESHMTYAVRVQAKSVNDRWSNMTDVKIVQFASQGMLFLKLYSQLFKVCCFLPRCKKMTIKKSHDVYFTQLTVDIHTLHVNMPM